MTEKYPFLHENDVLTEEFILKLKPEQQDVCNSLNRRTEFRVLRTTYGLVDSQGNLVARPQWERWKRWCLFGNLLVSSRLEIQRKNAWTFQGCGMRPSERCYADLFGGIWRVAFDSNASRKNRLAFNISNFWIPTCVSRKWGRVLMQIEETEILVFHQNPFVSNILYPCDLLTINEQ